MLNESPVPLAPEVLHVIDGLILDGAVNTDDTTVRAQVASAIRRGYPQVRPDNIKYDRICLVGGGPSLKQTEPELRQLLLEGALLVTVNGAYHWCLERNYRPQTQIVMDARPGNARFVDPVVPRCRYVLASQCHPSLWDAMEGRENVWIFHASAGGDEALKAMLDAYYMGQWIGVGGGTTVVSRAISMLRTLGYLRFDLFGVDSCWMDGSHHAYPQAENNRDGRHQVIASSSDAAFTRTFTCAPWHLKQAEDFLQMIRVNGEHFKLHVHGDGMLAYILRSSADVTLTPEQER